MNELMRKVDTLQSTLDRLLAGLRLPPKSNHAAIAAPGVGDDEDDGYMAGSFWTDVSSDTGYMCMDATSGAAVWKQITL